MAFADRVSSMIATVTTVLSMSVTIRRRQTGGLDFSTMSESSVVSSTQTVNAVRNRSLSQTGNIGKVRSLVETYTVAAADLAFTPDQDDTLVRNGVDGNIRKVELIASAQAFQLEVEFPV